MSNSKDQIGDRQKRYEDAYRHYLPIRMPVMLRLDGKDFSKWTKGLQRPFDQNLIDVLNETATYLCENIQGAQLAYCQSDEISLLLVNYKSLDSESWFENNIQKMVSVASGMASSKLTSLSHHLFGETKIATFDCRAFILPKEEVNNCLYWRQLDASRNSVQMVARSLYSHSQCNNKNVKELQEMIFQKGINWNDLPTHQKRGRCIVRKEEMKEALNKRTGEIAIVNRRSWVVDNEIPRFSKDPDYVNKLVFIEPEKEET